MRKEINHTVDIVKDKDTILGSWAQDMLLNTRRLGGHDDEEDEG